MSVSKTGRVIRYLQLLGPSIKADTGIPTHDGCVSSSRAEAVPVPHTPLCLVMQELEVDGNGKFQFLVSHIVSTAGVEWEPPQAGAGAADDG